MSDQSTGPRVQMKMGFKTKRRGRKVLELRQDAKCQQELKEAVSRQVRLLALAHRWQRMIDEGEVESQAKIAEMVGLSRARVSQIMDLRWLNPAMQNRLCRAGNASELAER